MEYKYWFELERHLDKCFFKIRELSGDISQQEKERLFKKYIDKYFKVWDDMSCALNGDFGFPPVYFAWWAEQNNIEPTYPIRICRKKERIVSAARRQHQKNIMTGRKYTDDHKAKIGKANKGKIHWWNKGVPQSEKQKKAVSEKLKIPILQFDLDGSFIKEWDSTKSASIFYKVSTSCICACINGKSKTSIGFVWSKK